MRRCLVIWTLLWGAAIFAQQPGLITTVVGTGKEASLGGVGGTAAQTPLHYPFRVAVDKAGNLYFLNRAAADADNALWKVSPDGVLSRLGQAAIWGDGLAVDSAGNVYASDERMQVVYKLTPAGVRSVVAGVAGARGFLGDGGAATAARLDSPRGLALDGLGNLYIADSGNNRIRKVTPAGIITTVAGTGTAGFNGDGLAATQAHLAGPRGVAVDAAGNLYVADTSNARIRKISGAGIISTLAGPGMGSAAEQLQEPVDLALDAAGNIYVADRVANKIRKITPAGVVSTVAGTGRRGFGGDGGAATAADLNLPGGVAVDASYNLYVADTFNFRIRKVTLPLPAGAALTITTPSPLPTATVGARYSVTLAGGGGVPPYRWSLAAGLLPPGLSLVSTTGVVSGTPTTPGTFTFTVRLTDSGLPPASVTKQFLMTVGVPEPKGLRFTGLNGTIGPATQLAFGLTLEEPYPLDITGQIALAFVPNAFGIADDVAIQFASGGRTLNFRIPANSLEAEFPQGSPMFQSGTTAGAITLRVTSMSAGGASILPSPPPSRELTLPPQAPVITSARFVPVSGGFQVVVAGYATPREVRQATFQFVPAAGANLATTSITADVGTQFENWYKSADSARHGSRFTLTATFSVEGSLTAIGETRVSLSNAHGTSATVTAAR